MRVIWLFRADKTTMLMTWFVLSTATSFTDKNVLSVVPVLSTCIGLYPSVSCLLSCPHVSVSTLLYPVSVCCPGPVHMCRCLPFFILSVVPVLSTCVGLYPSLSCQCLLSRSCPHVSVSTLLYPVCCPGPVHMCRSLPFFILSVVPVLSTCVGLYPSLSCLLSRSCPHVSVSTLLYPVSVCCPVHMCRSLPFFILSVVPVLSTCVGLYPSLSCQCLLSRSCPHVSVSTLLYPVCCPGPVHMYRFLA